MVNHPTRSRIAAHNYDVMLGQIVYLIRKECLDSGRTEYAVQIEAPTTNQSGEIVEDGWLGATKGISRYACGRVELTKWGAANGTVHFRKVR